MAEQTPTLQPDMAKIYQQALLSIRFTLLVSSIESVNDTQPGFTHRHRVNCTLPDTKRSSSRHDSHAAVTGNCRLCHRIRGIT